MNRKELNPDASPQAAFGARLRSARVAHGWKQEDLSALMKYSCGHISAVETGRKMPSLRFSRSADAVFGLEGAADTFERAWREIHHGSLLEGFPEYVGYEGRAAEIRVYEVGVVPGLLQTPAYAAAIEAGHVERGAITTDQAQERVSFLAERQAMIARNPPPLVHIVLDEGCIRRPVGNTSVMEAQMARLIAFAEQPNATLQVADFSMGVRRPFSLPITVLTLPDRSLMSYAESATRGHLDRETSSVLPLLTAYHQMQKHALPQAGSVAMIDQVRKGTL
ncbi:Scr1 family TA system antitoxin-like transcriptional regulator [Streptomyces sp. NPDC056716]|uniref:helix-turn-helix domain-containing protein n=1 Tax=unclassified Streptomyces TaxID=2593676 RepID=UPI00368EE888